MCPRLLVLAILVPAGCAGPDTPEPCARCSLSDANNFHYSANLDVAVAPIAEGGDAVVSWAGLAHDLQGHAVDPYAGISSATLVAFRDLSPEQVADGLADDTVYQSDVTLFVTCAPVDAACRLSAFSVLDNPVDVPAYLDEGAATWLLALREPGSAGAAALLFLEPRADSTADAATIDDGTSRLEADVDLRSLDPVAVRAQDSDVSLDWSALATDGLGNPLAPGNIDGAFLARYDAPLDELEGRVFDLLTLTDDVWTADVTGVDSLALAAMTGSRPFPGVDAGGTWLFALTCSTCSNPAPRFVTVLSGIEE